MDSENKSLVHNQPNPSSPQMANEGACDLEGARAAFVRKVARVSSGIGFCSGEPALEIAGMILSHLAANPEHIERFMVEGGELFIDGTIRPELGALTYRAGHGGVMSPAELRASKGQRDQ